MAKLGVPEPVIGDVLNHSKESITSRVYIVHEYAAEKRRALELWERRLLEIVEGHPASGERW